MSFTQSPGADTSPDDTLPADPTALAELVRARLGRRMIVAVLAPPSQNADALRALADALAASPGARVAYERLPDAPADLESFLARLHSLGPDVVLVGMEEEGVAAPIERPWHLRVFAIADRIGLCDRGFVALVGSHVTRQSARRAGFEDGFPLDT